MIIGVIGFGVVGNAVYEGLSKLGHEVWVNDVKDIPYHIHTLEEMVLDCEVIFICVNTPTLEKGCDLTNVYEVFNKLHYEIAQMSRSVVDYESPVIAVKSTVIPGTVDTLYSMYPFVCSNPEFMREATAVEDFLHPDRIIIGAHSERVMKTMQELYKDFGVPIFFTEPKVAELAKYMNNAFLVTKVAFSQEVKHICDMLGIDANAVMSLVCKDHRINDSHMNPDPGPIPLDSVCLPKDLRAMIIQLEKSGYISELFDAVWYRGIDVESPIKQALYEVLRTRLGFDDGDPDMREDMLSLVDELLEALE